MQSSTNIGPITTPAQYKKVLEYIDIAKSAGARCLLGGKPASGEGIVGGQLVEPTIFTGVNNTMRIARVAKQQKRQVNILRRRTTFYHFNGLGSPNGGLSAFRRNIQRQLSYFSRSYALGCARRAKTMLAISMSWSDQ
jgi:hypothetical protein